MLDARNISLLHDCLTTSFDMHITPPETMEQVFQRQMDFIKENLRKGHLFEGEAAAASADIMLLARMFHIDL